MAETIKSVRATFIANRDAITALDGELAEERKELKVRAFLEGRPLSPEEVVRRKEIASTRFELADSLEELALETVDALETATDLDVLLNELKAVNQQLADDLEHLKMIERYTALAAKVAKLLAEAADKLAKLRPSLI